MRDSFYFCLREYSGEGAREGTIEGKNGGQTVNAACGRGTMDRLRGLCGKPSVEETHPLRWGERERERRG